MATLLGVWVSAGTGRSGVSILWPDEMESWICNFYLVWQHVKLSEQIRPWDTLACCWDVKQPTTNQPISCFINIIILCRVSKFVTFQWLSFVRCWMPQQQSCVSQVRICTYCRTEIEVAGQTVYLTQSQFTDTGLTSPRPYNARHAAG